MNYAADALHEHPAAIARQFLERELVRVQRQRIHHARLHRQDRAAYAIDVHVRVSLVRVDDVEPAPVPELHVYLSWSILVITSDDQPATLARQLTREIE